MEIKDRLIVKLISFIFFSFVAVCLFSDLIKTKQTFNNFHNYKPNIRVKHKA